MVEALCYKPEGRGIHNTACGQSASRLTTGCGLPDVSELGIVTCVTSKLADNELRALEPVLNR